jgi:hypothetical protein
VLFRSVLSGEQTGADPERVVEILNRFPLIHVEMQPGDVLFFHPNLLHCSEQNHSENPRWSMICCYNAKSNNPYKESHHPSYIPLLRVPDSAIRDLGAKRFSTSDGKVAWLQNAADQQSRTMGRQNRET